MSLYNRLTKEELERNRDLYRQVRELIKEQQKQIDKDCGRTDYENKKKKRMISIDFSPRLWLNALINSNKGVQQ